MLNSKLLSDNNVSKNRKIVFTWFYIKTFSKPNAKRMSLHELISALWPLSFFYCMWKKTFQCSSSNRKIWTHSFFERFVLFWQHSVFILLENIKLNITQRICMFSDVNVCLSVISGVLCVCQSFWNMTIVISIWYTFFLQICPKCCFFCQPNVERVMLKGIKQYKTVYLITLIYSYSWLLKYLTQELINAKGRVFENHFGTNPLCL